MATDGLRVYFGASDGVLHGVTVDGGGPFAIPIFAGDASPSAYELALNDGVVYWTVSDSSQGAVASASTTSLKGGVLATTSQGPGDVASDGTTVYWVTGTGQIMDCALARCSPGTLAQGEHPGRILVDDVAVYWPDSTLPPYEGGNGSLWKLAK